MPVLTSYSHFDGRHPETGTVHNACAFRGFKAPHTARPYSEAFLLGVTGGITVGYFTFAYQGYDPQCNILTRNTFDPLDKLLSRLGVVRDVRQTRSPQRAADLLLDTLESGTPVIVWADRWSMPYNGLARDEGMWGSWPLLVYGYDVAENRVYLADRAGVPLKVSPADLAEARGRIKKDRYRMMTLEGPDPAKAAPAALDGINEALRLFTEKPPKGSKNNFGLAALQTWSKALSKSTGRKSWANIFPTGAPLYAGLKSAYEFAFLFYKDERQDAERTLYAEFLDEAVDLLDKPGLKVAADKFRASALQWKRLPACLLAEDVEPLGETRRLMWQRHKLFLQQGDAALAQMKQIDERLAAIRRQMDQHFPLTEQEATAYKERIAEQLEQIETAETAAVAALRAAVTT